MGGRGAEAEGCSEELARAKADRRAVVPKGVVQRAVLVAGDGEDVNDPERQRADRDGGQNQAEVARPQ